MLGVVLLRVRGPLVGCIAVAFFASGAAAALSKTDVNASPPPSGSPQPPFASARAPLLNTPAAVAPPPDAGPATADKGEKRRILLGWTGEALRFDRPAPRNLIDLHSDDVVEVGRPTPRKLDETNPFESPPP
jgi:hypothetical protein